MKIIRNMIKITKNYEHLFENIVKIIKIFSMIGENISKIVGKSFKVSKLSLEMFRFP